MSRPHPLYQEGTQPSSALAVWIVGRARGLGFELAGLVAAGPAATAPAYHAWLQKGYHGEMAYLARPEAVLRRDDSARILPGLRSILVVGANYHTLALPAYLRDDPSRGIVASYAWGTDYHELLLPRLERLAAEIQAELGGPIAFRAYVDTGPVLERDLALRAGLGFIGRNTALIHPRLGSWLLLGELLLDLDLPPVRSALPHGACGRCQRCLDACPTGALVAPYLLDSRRCISYLTIELGGPIPRELRRCIGNRIFGCDLCQEVCPWNRRFARPSQEAAFGPVHWAIAPPLIDLLSLDEAGFRARFRHSPLRRAKRRGLLRSVAVALGNWGDPAAVPALTAALRDGEPLIRGHAAWSLGRIGAEAAVQALRAAHEFEPDGWVQQEIQAALSSF